jgi:hypothetical protein
MEMQIWAGADMEPDSLGQEPGHQGGPPACATVWPRAESIMIAHWQRPEPRAPA